MKDPYKDHWYYRLFYSNGRYDYPLCLAVTACLLVLIPLAAASFFANAVR